MLFFIFFFWLARQGQTLTSDFQVAKEKPADVRGGVSSRAEGERESPVVPLWSPERTRREGSHATQSKALFKSSDDFLRFSFHGRGGCRFILAVISSYCSPHAVQIPPPSKRKKKKEKKKEEKEQKSALFLPPQRATSTAPSSASPLRRAQDRVRGEGKTAGFAGVLFFSSMSKSADPTCVQRDQAAGAAEPRMCRVLGTIVLGGGLKKKKNYFVLGGCWMYLRGDSRPQKKSKSQKKINKKGK